MNTSGLDEQVSQSKLQTMVIVILSIASLWVVNVLSRPFDRWKAVMLLTCCLIFAGIFILEPLRSFFGFELLSATQSAWSIVIGALCALGVEITHRTLRGREMATG
ncbi:MAG: hypothetical protein ACKOFA_06750 [Rhodoluna sp.]